MHTWRTVLAAGVVGLVALSGCSDDDAPSISGGGDNRGETVAADEWAAGVCTSVGDWVGDLQGKVGALTSSLAGASNPAQAKERLQQLADDVVGSTDAMIEGVERAGTPDVDRGDELARDMSTSLGEIRGIFEDMRRDIDALPTDSPAAFVEATGQISTNLEDAFERFGSSFDELSTKYRDANLDEQFNEVEACRDLQS